MQLMAESEFYQSTMSFFLSGLFPFCEVSLHPGTGLEQDSKKKMQDAGPPVKPASLSAFPVVAGDLPTDAPPVVLRPYGICRG